MKPNKILILFALLISNIGIAQRFDIKKDKWHWNNSQQDTVAGYVQVLKVDRVLYISGVVATYCHSTMGIDGFPNARYVFTLKTLWITNLLLLDL